MCDHSCVLLTVCAYECNTHSRVKSLVCVFADFSETPSLPLSVSDCFTVKTHLECVFLAPDMTNMSSCLLTGVKFSCCSWRQVEKHRTEEQDASVQLAANFMLYFFIRPWAVNTQAFVNVFLQDGLKTYMYGAPASYDKSIHLVWWVSGWDLNDLKNLRHRSMQ